MFRFTIRDVLWLTVVVGIPLGYWVQFRQDTAAHVREVEAKYPHLKLPAPMAPVSRPLGKPVP